MGMLACLLLFQTYQNKDRIISLFQAICQFFKVFFLFRVYWIWIFKCFRGNDFFKFYCYSGKRIKMNLKFKEIIKNKCNEDISDDWGLILFLFLKLATLKFYTEVQSEKSKFSEVLLQINSFFHRFFDRILARLADDFER